MKVFENTLGKIKLYQTKLLEQAKNTKWVGVNFFIPTTEIYFVYILCDQKQWLLK